MIRPARPDDRERLREIQATLREPNPPLLDYALDGPALVLVSTARPADSDARDTSGGAPVGYLLAFGDDETAYVAEIAVSPAHRREGRAARLLEATFERLRDRSRVTLSVHPENEAARRLYESVGFEVQRREADYYADGSDAIVMGRDL